MHIIRTREGGKAGIYVQPTHCIPPWTTGILIPRASVRGVLKGMAGWLVGSIQNGRKGGELGVYRREGGARRSGHAWLCTRHVE